MSYVARLRAIQSALQDVVSHAADVKSQLDQAAQSYQATTQAVVASQQEAQAHIARTISSMSGAAATVHESAAAISSSSSRAAEATKAAAQTVATESQRIATAADTVHDEAKKKLADLEYLLKQSGNIWDTQVVELIEAIKIGGAPVELLISQFGDAMIEGKRLTEWLQGANLKGYQHDLRDLITELGTGQAVVSDALAFLGESQLSIAKKFKEVIEMYKAGKVSLQFVLDQAERIRHAMPDSDFADLAGAIENALKKGHL